MQGVVPAAGEGTRLGSLTDGTPKGLVRVGGRPLLAHCFETLLDLGVEALLVVVGYEGHQIREHFGDSVAGTPVRYVAQGEPIGLADAVRRVEPYVEDDFVVLNGDNVVDADLRPVLNRHRSTDADATLLVDEVGPDRAAEGGVVSFGDDGRPTSVVEKPVDPPSTWVTRGFYAFSTLVFPACHLIRPSATGEYELSTAVDLLLHAGAAVETVPFEGRCVNVNAPDDLAHAEELLAE